MTLPRKHYNPRGRPKRWFETREEAEEERDRRCPGKRVYPCELGSGIRHWHIGGHRDVEEIRAA